MSGTRVRRSGSVRAAVLGAALFVLVGLGAPESVAARLPVQGAEGGAATREGEIGQDRKEPAWKKRMHAEFPEAPEEALDRFLAAVRARPDYQTAQGLRKEPVVAAVSAWADDLDFIMVANIRTFLDYIEDWDFPGAPGESFNLGKGWWDIENPGPGEPDGIEFFQLTWSLDTGESLGYRVHPDRLEDLRFPFALQIVIRQAIYRKLERHSVQRETITEVMDRLCRMAGVEFSYSSAQSGEIRITQELRNRTIRECLEQAATVAGFEVVISGKPFDAVEFEDIRERLAQLRTTLDPTEAATVGPMDVLKEITWKKALAMKEKGLMVTLAPKRPSNR